MSSEALIPKKTFRSELPTRRKNGKCIKKSENSNETKRPNCSLVQKNSQN